MQIRRIEVQSVVVSDTYKGLPVLGGFLLCPLTGSHMLLSSYHRPSKVSRYKYEVCYLRSAVFQYRIGSSDP
jgi:hypothetical protein